MTMITGILEEYVVRTLIRDVLSVTTCSGITIGHLFVRYSPGGPRSSVMEMNNRIE